MKRIAIIILVPALFVFVDKGKAQKAPKKEGMTFGIRFGGHLTKVTGTDSQGHDLAQDWKLGAHIGVNVEIPIASNFYVQPGLLFTNKGSKITETLNSSSVTSTTYITYIEIPVNLLYKSQLGTGSMFVGFGPYMAYGIHGQFKQDPGSNEKLTFKNTVKQSDDPDGNYIKPFDAGFGILVDYQFKTRFSVQLNGQLGLLGIAPKFEADPDDKSSYKNVGFGISLGYRFHPKHS